MSSNNVVSVPTKTKPHVVFTDSTEADNLLAFKHIEKRIRGNCPTLTALHVVIEIIFVDLVTEVYAYGDHDSNRHKRLVVRISCDLKQHCKYIVDVYADEKGRGRILLSTQDVWFGCPETAMLAFEGSLVEKKEARIVVG